MAVCVQCGASTSAKQCPRCGGQTSPYAAPRPEAERRPAMAPPAQTTVVLATIGAGPYPDLPKAGEGTLAAAQTTSDARVQAPASFVQEPGHPAVAPPAPAPSGATVAPATSGPLTGRSVAIALSVALVLVGLGLVAWWQMHRAPGITTVARPAVTQTVVNLPRGAVACAAGDEPAAGRQVFTGNAYTSCSLAQNVRAALGAQGTPVTVEAYSPRTGRSYRMACTGNPNVTCTGGSGAVVYLVPREARVVVPTP